MKYQFRFHKEIFKADPRLPENKITNYTPLLNWKKNNITELSISDFIKIPDIIIHFYIFIRKIRKKIYCQFLKSKPIISKVWDYKLVLPLKNKGIGHDLAIYGFRELDHRYIIQKLLKPNSVVCDLGANFGYYVVMYHTLLKGNVYIYAIEPDPRNIKYLYKNLILNKIKEHIVIEQSAMADYCGFSPFNLAEETNLNGLQFSALNRKYIQTTNIQVRDFAGYISSLPHKIDILRMDIEGTEVRILRSLAIRAEEKKSITWAPKYILFEAHAWEYKNYDNNLMYSSIQILFKMGYYAKYLCNAVEIFSPIRTLGYKPEVVINTGVRYYGIYKDVKNIDALHLICFEPGITTVCLELKN